ncbi:heavy metal translocating P-type ATPase [Rappaport israeli]|uniref:heavy metal translocating P-type ATPase n=1 Tax=Rappaport israeli TaxID=1839807 RepID=UPI000931C6A9|nr:heavy metal translocating P-type ATPase metal-binding domain-containing protein [Rappaport israeli]
MSQHCYHCHSAIAQGTAVSATINGQTQQFCCHACLGVASLIDQHNLNQYYQVRQQASPRPNQNHDQSHWQAYDIDAIAQQYLHSDNDSHELHLYLDNIHCAACAWLIRSALQDIHNLQHIHINTTTARAQIRWHKDHPLKLSQLLQTLDQLGYPPHLHTPEQSERHYHQQRNQQLLRLIIAGLGSMQVMMLSTGLYTGAFHGIDRNYSELLRWVSLGISIPVLFYSGHPILKSAWQGLRQRHINMDLPIALATVGAFIASAYHTLLGQGEVYFDSVTMFIFFISISRFIEFLTRRRAQHNEHRFARLLPDAVYKLINNTPQLVPLNTIQTNDHLHIPPTHTIPVDGIIQTGTTRIDQSMLTGESDALYKQTGDTVLAGTTNLESPITLKATQTGQQTTLAGIRRLIARAEQHRSQKLKRSETIAQNAILLVLILAIAATSSGKPSTPAAPLK